MTRISAPVKNGSIYPSVAMSNVSVRCMSQDQRPKSESGKKIKISSKFNKADQFVFILKVVQDVATILSYLKRVFITTLFTKMP
jgi:hypothetical protein